VSAEPQFDTAGNLTSLVKAAPPGGSVTYKFTASQPGTYIYQSGTEPGKQVQMGLFGMLIVRPTGHPDWAYNDAATQFNPNTEFMLLFTEVDPFLHQYIEHNQPYDVTQLHSRYWMINGRTFPDTIQQNGSTTLPQQPQGALIHIHPKDVSNPLPALVRYASVGSHDYPFHPHGMHGRVIARDGRELQGPAGEDLSYEKFTVLLGMGQTLDATYIFTDIEKWNPNTNPIPVPLPQQQNLTYKGNATWFSGSPYLGSKGPLPTGVTQYNQCGEYYQAWHNHDLWQAANYDAGFGGQFTLERIDPPMPNTCP
jgi:FtsP/CotA-like multicopper oxidase with cupredoxin domain